MLSPKKIKADKAKAAKEIASFKKSRANKKAIADYKRKRKGAVGKAATKKKAVGKVAQQYRESFPLAKSPGISEAVGGLALTSPKRK
jgi:hypothetical protein